MKFYLFQKSRVLIKFIILFLLSSLSSAEFSLPGKFKSTDGQIYQFNQNTILKNAVPIHVTSKITPDEAILFLNDQSFFILRTLSPDSLSLITPDGTSIILIKYDEQKEFLQKQESLNLQKQSLLNLDMVQIPHKKYKILRTEVTQALYQAVMGQNPSYFQPYSQAYADQNQIPYQTPQNENQNLLPVESVSWYDAIYFCNKLSQLKGKTPVYSLNGTTQVDDWYYTPHHQNPLSGNLTINPKANGYRLPTAKEWTHAAKNSFFHRLIHPVTPDQIAWFQSNSRSTTHQTAQKSPNANGLYDMSGNVSEWCQDNTYFGHPAMGGHFQTPLIQKNPSVNDFFPHLSSSTIGFRILSQN